MGRFKSLCGSGKKYKQCCEKQPQNKESQKMNAKNLDGKKSPYINRFYQPKATSYDFMSLFCALLSKQQEYSFCREHLIEFIKSCQINRKYKDLLDDIRYKSNGVFNYSDDLDDAIFNLKLGGILYTISPERDSQIFISEDISAEELIKPRIKYVAVMAEFIDEYNAEYGLKNKQKVQIKRYSKVAEEN